MKPIYIIQIGFSTLKVQKMAVFLFFCFLWVLEEERRFNTAELLHTAVCLQKDKY